MIQSRLSMRKTHTQFVFVVVVKVKVVVIVARTLYLLQFASCRTPSR